MLELPGAYCSADTVRRQYRLLAKRYHPDNSRTGDEKKFEEVQEAYEWLSAYFHEEGEAEEDGWTESFAAEFRLDALSYAPPSKDLKGDIEAVQKALARKPVDYEGLLLRTEWLEHNLTDGSCDGAVLLKTLGEVQKMKKRVEKAEKAVEHIGDRINAVQEFVQAGEDLLMERRAVPTVGNVRYKASLTRRFHTAMKRAADCLQEADSYRKELSRIERFCTKSVMSRRLLKMVQEEKHHLDDIEDYYQEIEKDGKILTFPAGHE